MKGTRVRIAERTEKRENQKMLQRELRAHLSRSRRKDEGAIDPAQKPQRGKARDSRVILDNGYYISPLDS